MTRYVFIVEDLRTSYSLPVSGAPLRKRHGAVGRLAYPSLIFIS